MSNQLANWISGVFLSLTGQAEVPKDYLYDHGNSAAFFLSHEGDCEDIGIKQTEVAGAVYMVSDNTEYGNVDVHVKMFQDYVRRDSFGIPWGQNGCIQKERTLSEIFFNHDGELFRQFSENEYGEEFVQDIVQTIEEHKERKVLSSSPKLGGSF